MGLEAATWCKLPILPPSHPDETSVEIAAEKDADIVLARHVVGTLDGTGSP